MPASKNFLRIAGLCGIAAPLVAFPCILISISLSPWFNWSTNALSDLGVREGAWLFNSGLVAAGILSMIFASGIWKALKEQALVRVGGALFFIDAFALFGIGVFSEAAGTIHTCFSAAFFVLFPLSLFLLGASSIVAGSGKFGSFTILIGVMAAIPWAFSWKGVAIPETISALAASAWSVTQGARLYLGQAERRPPEPKTSTLPDVSPSPCSSRTRAP